MKPKGSKPTFKARYVHSDGILSIINGPIIKDDITYMEMLVNESGVIAHFKLFEDNIGSYIKKGKKHYMQDFTEIYAYVPFQIKKVED